MSPDILFMFSPFLFSFLVTILTTPLTIILAKRLNLIDDPKLRPHPAHIQERTVPRAGGLPIFISIFTSILLFVTFDKHILGILIGIFLLLVIGLLDDALKNFKPIPRLFFQIAAAAIVVGSGIGISFITNPFGGILRLDTIVYPIIFLGTHNIILLADLLAFFWIVWMMNIVNWSKGVDGQMPAVCGIAALTIGFLSFKLYSNGDPNQLDIATLSLITAGSSFGFLIFNWYPSKIFPGFSGATILGFMIAVLSILSGAKLATALLVLLIPTVDFVYTFLRRILSKKSPFLGDKKHLHHLLLERGWSHRQISLFYITTGFILGVLATALSSEGKLFVALGVGIAAAGIILWLHLFSQNSKKS